MVTASSTNQLTLHADATLVRPLYRNDLSPMLGAQSIQIAPVNADGQWTRAGAVVTVRRESDGYVSSRVMQPGGGYASQGIAPAHFGLPIGSGPVSIGVSWFERGERRTTTVSGVDPGQFRGQWVVLCFYPGDFTFV